MKIAVEKADLASALRVAEIGMAGSGTDLTTHFVFRIHSGRVEILTTNSRVCALAPLTCQFTGEDGAAFTIEGKRLTRWLSGVGDVPVTLEAIGSDVRVQSARSTIDVPSLDASKFPFWDRLLSESKATITVQPDRLTSALNYAKNFISDLDTTRPEISQVEVLGGSLWATDKKAITVITLAGMEDSNLRLHGKDIPTITKFLGLKETEEVTLLEHDRALYVRRGDGALVGTSRPVASFPSLNVDKGGKEDAYFILKTEDILAGFQCLSAAADWANTQMKITFNRSTNQVDLKVKTVSGKENGFAVDCVEAENTSKIPEAGFWVDYPYIREIIGHFSSDTLKFGMHFIGKSGYIRFVHVNNTDEYLTVLVWRL